MVLSGAGYIWSGSSTDNYNGFKFTRQNQGWSTIIDGTPLLFTYHPADLEFLELDTDWISKARIIYFVFDPDSRLISEIEVARLDIQLALEWSNSYVITGVTEESEAYAIYPMADCNNATSLAPVIFIAKGNQTSVSRDGNCLVMSARDSFDVPRLKDRFLYSIYGVMQ